MATTSGSTSESEILPLAQFPSELSIL